MHGEPLPPRKKALLNRIAERALKRGRKLSFAEQLANIERALRWEPEDEQYASVEKQEGKGNR